MSKCFVHNLCKDFKNFTKGSYYQRTHLSLAYALVSITH